MNRFISPYLHIWLIGMLLLFGLLQAVVCHAVPGTDRQQVLRVVGDDNYPPFLFSVLPDVLLATTLTGGRFGKRKPVLR